ncbi:MAG: hypothetical protein KC422_17845 [Trueperaceae bacterium]|nr:hypothetical protein [Trueperaceae bacterium]
MHKFTLGFLVLVIILSACGRAPAPKSEPTLETLAATINVTTPIDELDLIPNNKCSLREAIVSANENRDVGGCSHSGSYGTETINIPAGTYYLTRECLLDSQDCDDLNIHSSMTINGTSATSTIIDASVLATKYASRVMRIGPRTWGNPFNSTVRLN